MSMLSIEVHLHYALPTTAVFCDRNANRAEFVDFPEKQDFRAVLLQFARISQGKQRRTLGIAYAAVELRRCNDGDLQLRSKIFQVAADLSQFEVAAVSSAFRLH